MTYTTYKWNDLSKRQQDQCRKARELMWRAGWAPTVSQLAKYWDATSDYLAGLISADELAPIVSAVPAES